MTTTTTALADRVDALDWDALGATLDDRGFAITEPLLHPDECDDLAALFDDGRFRSTIDMARHRFGDGRYRYFDHPLPAPIEELRGALYRRLAPVANRWSTLLSGTTRPSPPSTRSSSHAAAPPARSARRRSSCATARATGTRCTRTSTATSSSRSRP